MRYPVCPECGERFDFIDRGFYGHALSSCTKALHRSEVRYELEDGLVPGDFEACGECPHLQEWRESRGEFWGAPCYETMVECEFGGDPELCPYWPWSEENR